MSRFKLPPLLDLEGSDYKQIQTALVGMGEPSKHHATRLCGFEASETCHATEILRVPVCFDSGAA
jgi:hypothetical protein